MIDRLAFLKLFPAGLLGVKASSLIASPLSEATDFREELIYENPLSSSSDIKDCRLEGEAKLTFENGRLRMQNKLDPEEGQKSNFVLWCPQKFPKDVAIT